MSPTSGNDPRDLPRGRRVADGTPDAAASSDRPLTAMERLRLAQGIAAPSARTVPVDDDGLRPRTGERTLPFGDEPVAAPSWPDRAAAATPAYAPPAETPADPPALSLPDVADVVAAALGEQPAPTLARPDRAPGWRARRVEVDEVPVSEPLSTWDAATEATSVAEEVSLSAVIPSRPPVNPVPEVVTPSEAVAAELAELTPEAAVPVPTEPEPGPAPAAAAPPSAARTSRAERRARASESAPRADLSRLTTSAPQAPAEPFSMSRRLATGVAAFGALVLAGLAALVLAVLGVGPDWVDGAGSVAVVTGLAGLLAIRTNGQPWITAGVALVLGAGAVVSGQAALATGAAVVTCVVGGVYAVMATVPAVTFAAAAREVLWATLLSVVVALAVVGFGPTASVEPFEILTLLMSVALVMALVYRLGAGLHGLGRRGAIVIGIGFGLLAGALVYAELLRRYGAPGVVESVLDVVAWSQDHVYAFPRPLVVVLGIPALAWGAHMRARRRQGWWVAAFGVAATVPVATSLVGVDSSLLGALVRASYSLVCGLVLAWLIVWFDLRLTGPRGAGARRVEEASAHRPEPSRWSPL